VEGEGAKVPVTAVNTVVVGVGIVGAVVFGGLLVSVDVIDIVDLVVNVEVVDEVGCVEVDSVEVIIVNFVLVERFIGFAIVVKKEVFLVVVEFVVSLLLTIVSAVSVSTVVFGVRFS